MSDTTLNRFLAQGTNAERLAFTPSPPTPASGPDPGYLFYETDTDTLWSWDDVGSSWTQITSGSPFVNPMSAAEDLIVGGVSGTPERLAAGYVGQVLTVGSGGYLDWETPSPGFTNPMSAAMDLIVGGVSGAPSRLAAGYPSQVLTVGSGGYLDWESPPAASGLITTSAYTMNSGKLLGRTTAGLGAIEELAMGSGIATFLATPSSANLAAAVTDETGTGLLVFGTAPVFSNTIEVGTAGGTTGLIKLNGTTSGVVSLSVADVAGTWTMKLPTSAGSSGLVLSTDGAGNTSWVSQSGAADYLGLQVFF